MGAAAESTATLGPVQLSARTDGDLIVFFDCPQGRSPDEMIGQILPVRINRHEPLALHGVLA